MRIRPAATHTLRAQYDPKERHVGEGTGEKRSVSVNKATHTLGDSAVVEGGREAWEGGGGGGGGGHGVEELVTIALHIRRTDYVNYPTKHPMLEEDYYIAAMQVRRRVKSSMISQK